MKGSKTKTIVRRQECPICHEIGTIKISSQKGSSRETYRHVEKGCAKQYD